MKVVHPGELSVAMHANGGVQVIDRDECIKAVLGEGYGFTPSFLFALSDLLPSDSESYYIPIQGAVTLFVCHVERRASGSYAVHRVPPYEDYFSAETPWVVETD
jgi:hypothetical protein